jgi:2-polyprenyl-3-methyl-5-hydroxy-6-metoxy-1,4-benzoquinol methylase/glycosyltransferase involved in cell wall biosynthesis
VTKSWAFVIDSVEFTPAVVAGQTSLGGSESAALGLARALRARGEDVHVFTSKLSPDAAGVDHAGVTWHALDDFAPMNQFIEWDVVVALRMFSLFAWRPIYARLRVLWNQDLLVPGQMHSGVMGVAWALDQVAYVSDYHRRQWEQIEPLLRPIGWVTRNGFDPRDLSAAAATKDPNRIIHISRPERGLMPILEMWPALKAKRPDATLQICRYSSMYDTGPGSWSEVCASYDRAVQAMNEQVGGITYLGELSKPALYQAIADAAVMWYPGVASFAETSCIAALEAQANGTPFVGSYRGALPETVPSGSLIKGDPKDADYQTASIDAVCDLLDGCAKQSFDYRRRQREGRAHAKQFTYDTLAAQWDAQVDSWFEERYQRHRLGVMRQLLYEDDHVAAKVVAEAVVADAFDDASPTSIADFNEANKADLFCDYVIAGKDQTAEQYGSAAISDPLYEAEVSTRFKAVIPEFEHCASVLDVACGNGAFSLALALANPTVHVLGFDYSEANIARAREAAIKAGVSDRCTFEQQTVYDFDRQTMHSDWDVFVEEVEELQGSGLKFDGLFCGEFIEHVANHRAVIDGLEAVLVSGAVAVYTCPHGACSEMVPRGTPLRRGHVHRFHHDDLKAVWGVKHAFRALYLAAGVTERGNPLGNWLIRYTVQTGRSAGPRPLPARIQRTRPLPRLTVGIIAKDAENDLGRCLASIYKVADEIVVGDTGSTDQTKAIAASYGATVVDLPTLNDTPEGFAGARNAVLQHSTGEWFLWIDCDEQLINAGLLHRYLEGVVFNGFVLKQTHLYLDGAPTFDIPIRVFRNTGKVRFFGCIHEQPQDGEPNADIFPTLQVQDVLIAHTGYLTPDGREAKRVSRNLPLLVRDQKVFPDRLLGKVLALREAVLQADANRGGGPVTEYAQRGYAYAVQMFIQHFDDPGHKYHRLARPWYEAALRHLGLGWEQEIGLAGRKGGLEQRRPQPERIWVRDADEYERVMAFKVKDIAKNMAPVVFLTDPDALRPPVPQEAQVSA